MSNAVVAPTTRLLPSALSIASSASICAYHCVVKPLSGKAMNTDLLNENRGRKRTGT